VSPEIFRDPGCLMLPSTTVFSSHVFLPNRMSNQAIENTWGSLKVFCSSVQHRSSGSLLEMIPTRNVVACLLLSLSHGLGNSFQC
jgi:hypothetical protein